MPFSVYRNCHRRYSLKSGIPLFSYRNCQSATLVIACSSRNRFWMICFLDIIDLWISFKLWHRRERLLLMIYKGKIDSQYVIFRHFVFYIASFAPQRLERPFSVLLRNFKEHFCYSGWIFFMRSWWASGFTRWFSSSHAHELFCVKTGRRDGFKPHGFECPSMGLRFWQQLNKIKWLRDTLEETGVFLILS